MILKELATNVNDAIALRKPNEAKIVEYAERMGAAVEFPPITIGYWPSSEKYGDHGIVDGLHRLAAATLAELKEFPTVSKKFASLEEALLYMYQSNMAHGLPVTEGQRNNRIKLLRQIDPKLTLEKIGKMFELGKSSIQRVLGGEQGEGKSGPKGANKSKGQKSQEPLKAKAFFSTLERMDFTCKRVRSVADIIAYAAPESEEGVTIDAEKVKTIKAVIIHLNNLLKELS